MRSRTRPPSNSDTGTPSALRLNRKGDLDGAVHLGNFRSAPGPARKSTRGVRVGQRAASRKGATIDWMVCCALSLAAAARSPPAVAGFHAHEHRVALYDGALTTPEMQLKGFRKGIGQQEGADTRNLHGRRIRISRGAPVAARQRNADSLRRSDGPMASGLGSKTSAALPSRMYQAPRCVSLSSCPGPHPQSHVHAQIVGALAAGQGTFERRLGRDKVDLLPAPARPNPAWCWSGTAPWRCRFHRSADVHRIGTLRGSFQMRNA